MKIIPLILLFLTCCTTKQQSSEVFRPKEGNHVVETIEVDSEYFDGISLTADSTLENGSFNQFSIWKDGHVIFADQNPDGLDTINFSAFEGIENKVKSRLVFYHKTKQGGFLFVKGADYGCCVPTMTVVKVEAAGFQKIFDEAFYIKGVQPRSDGDIHFYGMTSYAEAIPLGGSRDTLISAYNPSVVLSLSNDFKMDSSATKTYNEREYVFAGYKYREEVKVIHSNDKSFKPYIYEEPKTDPQEHCVFDNDIRKLTSDWMNESGVESFSWDDKKKRAIIVQDGDTTFASQGGCEHFGIVVERKLAMDVHQLKKTEHWLREALKLADKFGLDFYASEIKAGNIQNMKETNGSLWYEVGDDDPSDNLYYNGIEVRTEGNAKTISISQYYN